MASNKDVAQVWRSYYPSKTHWDQVWPLRECDYAFVQQFRLIAKKEHVGIRPTKRQHWWFRCTDADREMGFCGMMECAKGRVRVKASYIHPEYRGMKLGLEMIKARARFAINLGYEEIEVYTIHPAMYEALEFHYIRKTHDINLERKPPLPHGCWVMRRAL